MANEKDDQAAATADVKMEAAGEGAVEDTKPNKATSGVAIIKQE